MSNCSSALVKTCETMGVEYIFGIPGTHVLSIYEALANSKIKTILGTHEPALGFMADAYSRIAHKPGVLLVTSGPGLLNVVNPVAQAYVESSPLLIIGSHVSRKLWGKGAYHELKHSDVQLNILKELTKSAHRVESPENISQNVMSAYAEATAGRPRPVFLEIPEDILDFSCKINENIVFKTSKKKGPSIEKINKFIKLLKKSKKPLIIAGGGILCSGAQSELIAFSEKNGIPITTTFMGKSACPSTYRLNYGLCSGVLAAQKTREYISECDFVIALGTRFDELATGFYTLKLPKNIVHIDIDKAEFNRNYPAVLTIESDVKKFLQEVMRIDSDAVANGKPALDRLSISSESPYAGTKIHPGELFSVTIEKLRNVESIFIGDAGNSALWLIESYIYQNHHVITPSGYNSMGFALPGAIGAKLASPHSTVIAFCGDGSFLMTGMEFITAVKYNVPIICIVLHDQLYNILTFFQDLKYSGKHYDTEINSFDFSKFAEELGGIGFKVTSLDEFEVALEKALVLNQPVLIDAYIDPIILPGLSKVLKAISQK